MAVKTKTQQKNKILAVILAVVIVLSAVAVTAIKSNSRVPVHYDFGKDEAIGIDVSEHNGKINWSKVKDEVDFAFIRVGYMGYGNGNMFEDKYAKRNMRAAKKAGIPFGVYFYSQAVNEEEAVREAEFVLKAVKRYDPELPLIIDYEFAENSEGSRTGRLYDANLSKDEATDIIKAFCSKITDKGYFAGVYASASVAYRNIKLKSLPSDVLLWIADYNGEVTYKVSYDVWQYTNEGKCDGIKNGATDFDIWYSKRNKV